MSAQDMFPGSTLNTLMRRESRLPVLGRDSALSMERISYRSTPTRIAVVGNHLPRQCGIATFTTDLCDAIAAESAASDLMVVAMNDAGSSYAYPARVRYSITEGELSSYQGAAKFLNAAKVDVVCLQHEYG